MGLILICLYCFQSDQAFSERGIPVNMHTVSYMRGRYMHGGKAENFPCILDLIETKYKFVAPPTGWQIPIRESAPPIKNMITVQI